MLGPEPYPHPVYRDNMAACPQPWLDRAQGLDAYATRLVADAAAQDPLRQKAAVTARLDQVQILQRLATTDPGAYRDALAAAVFALLMQVNGWTGALVGVRRVGDGVPLIQAVLAAVAGYTPPADREGDYRFWLGLVLMDLWRALQAAGQPDAALTAAVQATDALGQAAAHGVDASSVAINLRQLAGELAAAGHPAEAARTIQDALSALHTITPAAGQEADYFMLLGLVLTDQWRALRDIGQSDAALAAAVAAMDAFTQAISHGAAATSVAIELRQLAGELATAGHPAEAARAIQEAVDALQAATPPAGQEADFFTLFGLVLTDQWRSKQAAGQPDAALAAAVAAIDAFRRVDAHDAAATSVAINLRQLSSELAVAEHPAEAAQATQAALDPLTAHPPVEVAAEADYFSLLGLVQVDQWRILRDKGDDAAAVAVAVQAISALGQAAGHGADATSLAVELRQLDTELAAAGHPAEADQANHTALGVLQIYTPPPAEQASYNALLGVSLIDHWRRLHNTPGEESAAVAAAQGAIDAFIRAVAHGADPTSAATNLNELASELAAAGHQAEADQATQAAQHITG